MNIVGTKYSINFASYLYYLIPFVLLTGPFLPDLFLSTISIIFLIIAINNRNFKYFNNIPFYIFIVFYFYLLMSSLLSEFSNFSLKSSFVYFRFGIFVLATWFLIDHKSNFIKNFTIFLLITFTIALFDGYSQYIFQRNLFGHVWDWSYGTTRLRLLLDDKLILGGYLARIFPFLVALIVFNFKQTKKSYFIIFVIFILTDIIIYISGERTALALMLLSSIMMIFLMSKYKMLRIISLIISILVIIAITIISPKIKDRNIDLTMEQLGITQVNSIASTNTIKKLNLFSPIHEFHYKSALLMFFDNPIIGIGANNFRKLCLNDKYYTLPKQLHYAYKSSSCSTHPHNIYIQILTETGLIGFLIFLLLPIYLLFLIVSHIIAMIFNSEKKFNDYEICLIIAIVLSLWPLVPSNNFFNNWINVIYFLPIGFLLHSIYTKKNK